jgi:hypothetical protein
MVGAHSTEASPAQAVAILNRIGFGPSPADLQHVEHIGVDAYIDEQLQPQRLALPQGLSQRLSGLDTMQLQSAQLIEATRSARPKRPRHATTKPVTTRPTAARPMTHRRRRPNRAAFLCVA